MLVVVPGLAGMTAEGGALRSSPASRGRGTTRSVVEGATTNSACDLAPSTVPLPHFMGEETNLSPPPKPPLQCIPSLLTRGRAHEASSVRSRLKSDRHRKHPMSIGAAPADLCLATQIAGRPSRIARGQYDPLPVVVGRKAGGRAPNSGNGGRGASGDGVMPVSSAVLECESEGSKSPCAGGGSCPMTGLPGWRHSPPALPLARTTEVRGQ
jgi:hypothetical protein